MNRVTLRALIALLAAAITVGLAACHTDTEVERTKLPHIDGSEKPVEKSK